MDSWIVFAKEPVPGEVKTRLCPPLAPEDAAELYTAFVEDVCETVGRAAQPGDRRVIYAPEAGGPVLRRIAAGHGFAVGVQEGSDLGERMARALAMELGRGALAVVLVGSDAPAIRLSELTAAKHALGERKHHAVIGPAADGGYWTIGVRSNVPDLFEEIPWSTGDVLAATLERAKARRVDVGLLAVDYDVDDASDLRLLAARLAISPEPALAPRTAAAIADLKRAYPGVFR